MTDSKDLIQSTYQASAASWPFTAVSTMLFGMRTFSRMQVKRDELHWDDLVVSVSWVLDIVRASSFQKALDSTRRISATDPANTIPSAAFWVVFTDALSFLSIALPKLGVGILIIRLFRPRHWLKIAILSLCFVLNFLALVGFIITYVQCDPVAGQWDPFTHPQTVCWSRAVQIIYSLGLGGISAFMDIAFAVYPGIVVWRLQMPIWKKVSTIALMSLGLASFAIAIVKTVANTSLFGSPDVNALLSDGIHIAIWNSIENDFVLSAACLPAVLPFFRACKAFIDKHISPPDGAKRSTAFTSIISSDKSSHTGDTQGIELARNGELPGVWAHKEGNNDLRWSNGYE